MKEVKVNKDIERTIEAIFLHASALSELKVRYPSAVKVALKEFQLKDFQDMDFIPDDIDNFKLTMYALATADLKRFQEKDKKKKEDVLKKIKTNLPYYKPTNHVQTNIR